MKENEILEMEKKHLGDAAKLRKATLYTQGMFCRAYEYSAFLINRIKLKDLKIMRIEGKKPKIFLGIPADKIKDFLGEKIEVKVMSDTETEITIPDESFAEDERTVEDMTRVFNEWRNCVPLQDNEKPEGKQDGNRSTTGCFSILKEILEYPVERKSPIESLSFITELKTKISRIL